MAPFWKKLAVAVGLTALGVSGLQLSRSLGSSVTGADESAPGAAAPLPRPAAAPRKDATEAMSARKLIPSSAWLIVDFSTELAETAPFAGARDPSCAEVKPPPRAAVGIMPPRADDESPELVLAAAHVTRRFFECARDQILASGGRESPVNPSIDFLQSPTGILLHERRGTSGNLIFATGTPDLDSLVRSLLLDPRDLPSSPHDDVGVLAGIERPLAHASLVLPKGWLDSAGPDGARSPLRHARSGAAALSATGLVKVRVLCAPEGCAELRAFGERALKDVERKVAGDLGVPRWSSAGDSIELEVVAKLSALSPWLGRLGGLGGP